MTDAGKLTPEQRIKLHTLMSQWARDVDQQFGKVCDWINTLLSARELMPQSADEIIEAAAQECEVNAKRGNVKGCMIPCHAADAVAIRALKGTLALKPSFTPAEVEAALVKCVDPHWARVLPDRLDIPALTEELNKR